MRPVPTSLLFPCLEGARPHGLPVPATPSLRDCLALAVEIERAGALHYARLALRFQAQPPLRELFLSLAEDERSHEDQFERLIARVDRSRASLQSAGDRLRSLALHRFFTGSQVVWSAIDQVRSVRDVLEIALRFERDMLGFFSAVRADLTHEPDVDQLDLLIEAEREHVARLESVLAM